MDIRERFSRRRLLGGIGAFSAGSLLFAACGQATTMESGGETATDEMAKEEAEKPAMADPVEVSWLTHHNSRQLDNVDGLVKEPFEADNPGITLKWIIWTGDRREFLQTLVAGGQAPDVAWLTDPALTALGAVEAIDDRVAKDQIDLSPSPKRQWTPGSGVTAALCAAESVRRRLARGPYQQAHVRRGRPEPAAHRLAGPDWNFDRFTTEMRRLTKEDGGQTTQFVCWAQVRFTCSSTGRTSSIRNGSPMTTVPWSRTIPH